MPNETVDEVSGSQALFDADRRIRGHCTEYFMTAPVFRMFPTGAGSCRFPGRQSFPCAETEGQAEGCTVRFSLFSPDGGLKATWENACDGGRAESAVLVESPQLWWPRPYGAHPLYRLQTELLQDGTVLDLRSQNVGIREIRRVGDFQFTVNGTPIRLWGSNVAPFQAVSHRWDPARALKVLRLPETPNMNALRIWGEGVPYGEELYDFCDREGILLIHDLFSEYGYWPDDRAYRA